METVGRGCRESGNLDLQPWTNETLQLRLLRPNHGPRGPGDLLGAPKGAQVDRQPWRGFFSTVGSAAAGFVVMGAIPLYVLIQYQRNPTILRTDPHYEMSKRMSTYDYLTRDQKQQSSGVPEEENGGASEYKDRQRGLVAFQSLCHLITTTVDPAEESVRINNIYGEERPTFYNHRIMCS
uniref:Uncharacterized protein n=1 Tax=Molossus molossus TaxID=27622 RepID=A0A7J8F916_MOLMO|nr:hypothetical protein HJG59_008465 [Molossus molossus]